MTEKIRPSYIKSNILENYNSLYTGNYRTEYTKKIYDKKVISMTIMFKDIDFTQNYVINWYIENTEHTVLKDFINIELSSLYCPGSSLPLHISLFFSKLTKSDGLDVSYNSKILKVPISYEKLESEGVNSLYINLILQPEVTYSNKYNEDFWKKNTYITLKKVFTMPFNITRIFPNDLTTIKYLIILCSPDINCLSDAIPVDKIYYFFNKLSIKYPKVDIKIKEKLTCHIITFSFVNFTDRITHEFLNEIFVKCIKSKLYCNTYFINNNQ